MVKLIYHYDLCSTHAVSTDHQLLHDNHDEDSDNVISAYYRQNCNSPGRILYTVSCYDCMEYYHCTCILSLFSSVIEDLMEEQNIPYLMEEQ